MNRSSPMTQPDPILIDPARRERTLQTLERFARLLDESITVPATRFRFGADALLGLVPGVGDFLGALFSAAIVYELAKLGAPKRVLLRMVLNVAADALVGSIPLLGDMFDAAYKANIRNTELARKIPNDAWEDPRDHRTVVRLIAAALATVCAASIGLAVAIFRALWLLFTRI